MMKFIRCTIAVLTCYTPAPMVQDLKYSSNGG